MRECANGTEVYPTTEAEICHAYICRRHAGLTTSLEDALGGRATLAARASSSAWKTRCASVLTFCPWLCLPTEHCMAAHTCLLSLCYHLEAAEETVSGSW